MRSIQSPILDPSTIPQLPLESMNETHREEVELINQLGVLLKQGKQGVANDRATTEKLQEWIEHTRLHFTRENQLMQEHGFPAYPVHRAEHEQVLQQIEALQQQWLENKQLEPLAEFIANSWPRWFDNHVKSMDWVTARFLSQLAI